MKRIRRMSPFIIIQKNKTIVCSQLNIIPYNVVCLSSSLHQLRRIDINIKHHIYVVMHAPFSLPSLSKYRNVIIHVQWSRKARLSLQMILHPQLALIWYPTVFMNITSFLFIQQAPLSFSISLLTKKIHITILTLDRRLGRRNKCRGRCK